MVRAEVYQTGNAGPGDVGRAVVAAASRFLVLTVTGWSLAFSTHVLALLYLPALAFLLLTA